MCYTVDREDIMMKHMTIYTCPKCSFQRYGKTWREPICPNCNVAMMSKEHDNVQYRN